MDISSLESGGNMPNSLSPKFAHRIEPGQIVHSIDGNAYRVLSKIATADSFVFRLANLSGQPVETPANFHPLSRPTARFGSWLKYVLAYNKDLTNIVNSSITEHGYPDAEGKWHRYPIDPKMNWSAYVQEAMAPSLSTISPDFDLQDEAIYQVIVRALLDRDVLADFPNAIKKFPKGVQNLPLERQVSEYLKKVFVWRIQEAKKYMQTVQPYEEESLEQPAHDTEEGESYNLLDTDEHATGTEDFTVTESERDFKAFREEFYNWLHKKNKASAFGVALLLTIYWEQAQQGEGELKFGDLTQEWLRRSHLGFDSLKAYNTKLPALLKEFVYSHVNAMEGDYELTQLIQNLLPKKKEKAQPAKASSLKQADAIQPDIAEAKTETESPNKVDGDISSGRGEAVPIEKFAAKPTCPHCGSDDYGLMPTDFETAKCNKCGKNWEHGIVKGINDPPKTAFFSPEDAKKFRDENQGSNVALNQHEEGYQKWEPVFPEKDKEAAADLGQCSCEWEDCPLGHRAGGCPNPAAHMLEIYGFKTRYCQPCTDATIEYIRIEQGGGDPDDTVKVLSSDKTAAPQTAEDIHPPAGEPYCDGCDRLKKNCVCENCHCKENKKATLDPSDESYGYKCAVCGDENFTRSASGQLICMTCHPPKRSKGAASEDEKGSMVGQVDGGEGMPVTAAGEGQYTAPGLRVALAEDWFIYVTDELTEHMWVYNTEMWQEWGEIPNAFGEDLTKPQPGVDVMIPYAKAHTPQPLMDDAGKQMTLDEFTASNDWTDPFEESDKWIEKEGMLGHDFVDADQQAIRPDITPGDTGRVPHGRTQGSVKEGAAPAGALDIDQPVGVPTENWQCLNCGHEGMLSQHGKCEACGSDAVASTLPAPPEYARYGIDPLKKSGRSLQVLECCGSVTGYHKMDCPVYTKNFDETVARLKALGKRSALKAAGKWMVTLRDARGRTREQVVSAGENFGSAERAVQKYMKRGENIVFITVASKRAAAPAPAAAPAQAAPAPAPAPATPAVAPPSVVAPPPGTPLALQQQETPEEPLRHTVPPEIPNRKYHMTSRVLTIAQKHRLEKW